MLNVLDALKKRAWLVSALLLVGLVLLPFLVEASLGKSWLRIMDFALLYIMLAWG